MEPWRNIERGPRRDRFGPATGRDENRHGAAPHRDDTTQAVTKPRRNHMGRDGTARDRTAPLCELLSMYYGFRWIHECCRSDQSACKSWQVILEYDPEYAVGQSATVWGCPSQSGQAVRGCPLQSGHAVRGCPLQSGRAVRYSPGLCGLLPPPPLRPGGGRTSKKMLFLLARLFMS